MSIIKENKEQMKIIMANPRGFCAGVERAIEIVDRALKKYGAPIYVNHEIVHNKHVLETLKDMGVIFVDNDLDSVPMGGVLIFSAHGVSERLENYAKERSLEIIDATCPLVKKVHNEAQRYTKENRKLILIGHKEHQEVIGTKGRAGEGEVFIVENLEDVERLIFHKDDPLAYITQTTLSVDDTKEIIEALHKKYTNLQGPALNDICYATQNRQDAVKKMLHDIDLLLVIGSKNSSNSNRLKDLGLSFGIASYLIDNEDDIDLSWFENKKAIGITAGASAPEVLLTQVLNFLGQYFVLKIDGLERIDENIRFRVPIKLEVSQ